MGSQTSIGLGFTVMNILFFNSLSFTATSSPAPPQVSFYSAPCTSQYLLFCLHELHHRVISELQIRFLASLLKIVEASTVAAK